MINISGLWEFVAMRSHFFCHFDWRNGFLLSLLSFCYCDIVQKRNFYVETKIHIWKGCTVFTSDLLIRWQSGHWPRTLDDRIYYSMKMPLLLVLHILQFNIILRHLPYPAGKFYVWSLDLWFKKYNSSTGIQMFCIAMKQTT